jgi:hypothetical protein
LEDALQVEQLFFGRLTTFADGGQRGVTVSNGLDALLEAAAHRLERGDVKALVRINVRGVDTDTRLVGEECFEAVVEGLLDQGVAIREEEDFLCPVRPQEKVNQRHDGAGLPRARGHDEQGATQRALEGFANAADGLVLVGAVHDGGVDGGGGERLTVLVDEEEPFEVGRAEEAGDHARMSKADFPEPGVQAVRHEAKRGEVLLAGDLGDVLAELLLPSARIAGSPLGFHHAEHSAGRMVETEVGDAVPRRWIVADNRHLETNLCPVAELPARSEQLRVDEQGAGLRSAQFHHVSRRPMALPTREKAEC